MLNYFILKFTVGTEINYGIEVPIEDHNFNDEIMYDSFLCVCQSVFDSTVFYKLCIKVNREENYLVLYLNSEECKKIIPGRYEFDLLYKSKKCKNKIEVIGLITKGIIYFESSMGLLMINYKKEDPYFNLTN